MVQQQMTGALAVPPAGNYNNILTASGAATML